LTRRAFVPRKSALDDFTDIIGVIPDKDVAEKAQVSPENVRTYRLRRGIPATFRGESPEALQAKQRHRAAKKVVEKPVRRKKRKMRRRRRSRLDPYLELLGDVPDRELAERAGVTPENVRAYRVRRGVPARWRGESGESDGGSAPAERPAPNPVPSARATSGAEVNYAYRVVADVDGESREYVVFASNMADAAVLAGSKLRKLSGSALLRELSLVGEAL
jgi:hypothetical protein